MTTSVEAVYTEAVAAAKAAEVAFREKHGEPFYCGFAWVELYVERTNSKIAKELIAAGFKKDYKPKTLSVWNPGDSSTQSMDIKECGARAFAAVFQKYGYRAFMCSRAD